MALINLTAAACVGATLIAVSAPVGAQTAVTLHNGSAISRVSDNFGDCIGSTIPSLKRRASRVFEATVTSVKPFEYPEFVATLDVHRVWKGDTSSTATVYFTLSTEGPVLDGGKRYIFFAEPLTLARRKAFGVVADHPDGASWVPPCSGPIPPAETAVKQLGRSRKPKSGRHLESSAYDR